MRKSWLVGVLAMSLVVVAGAGRAEEPTQAMSPLGQAHITAGLSCINCHATATPSVAASAGVCLTCHGNADGKYIGVVRKYQFDGGVTVEVDPHQPHLLDLPCTECHKAHVASVNYCNQCHLYKDMVVK